MLMKKVFISMPMRNKSIEEIKKIQADVLIAVANKLNEEIEHVETFLNDKVLPLESLSENLKRIAGSDYVAFLEGWENARGCKIERACAEAYGIPFFDIKKL